MKTTIVIFFAFPILLSCESLNKSKPSICGEDYSGHIETKLYYEEDDIRMKWKTKAPKKSEFWIKLRPTRPFREKLVTIDGVEGTLPSGGNTNPDWLDTSGTWKNTPNHRFVLCVPNVPEETEYKFDVIIEDIGTLDPRLEVTR